MKRKKLYGTERKLFFFFPRRDVFLTAKTVMKRR